MITIKSFDDEIALLKKSYKYGSYEYSDPSKNFIQREVYPNKFGLTKLTHRIFRILDIIRDVCKTECISERRDQVEALDSVGLPNPPHFLAGQRIRLRLVKGRLAND